jgi:hypothetical protein
MRSRVVEFGKRDLGTRQTRLLDHSLLVITINSRSLVPIFDFKQNGYIFPARSMFLSFFVCSKLTGKNLTRGCPRLWQHNSGSQPRYHLPVQCGGYHGIARTIGMGFGGVPSDRNKVPSALYHSLLVKARWNASTAHLSSCIELHDPSRPQLWTAPHLVGLLCHHGSLLPAIPLSWDRPGPPGSAPYPGTRYSIQLSSRRICHQANLGATIAHIISKDGAKGT